MPSSHEILQAAENCLRERTGLVAGQVSCELGGDTLLLRGCVTSYYQKQLVQEAVKRVDGVRGVVNDVEVRGNL
jgi:osmotically-inducible protein OsmY